MCNKALAEELRKPNVRKFGKKKLHYIANICGNDLANMQLISKFNKGFRFVLCVVDT